MAGLSGAQRQHARRMRRRVVDNALRLHHRNFRIGLGRYVLSGELLTMLTAPII